MQWELIYRWIESSVDNSARRSSCCHARGSTDCEMHLFHSWEPLLLLVCPISQPRSSVLPKIHCRDNLIKGNHGFQAEFNTSQASFPLKKPSVLRSNSAVYFCAVTDTVMGTAEFAEHRPLSTVKPLPEAFEGCVVPEHVTHITKSLYKATEFVHLTNVHCILMC